MAEITEKMLRELVRKDEFVDMLVNELPIINLDAGTITGLGALAMLNTVTATEIDNFAVTATKIYSKIIILNNDVWTSNSPGGGSISWNAHQLVYNGNTYNISAGSTAYKYVYWLAMDTAYTVSNTHPGGTDVFVIATNQSGIYCTVWNASANMVIGTAFILDAAIVNAKIADCSVSKLTAGTITSKTITLSVSDGSGDSYIAAGKTDFTNVGTAGFILGIDDDDSNLAKFYIGNSSYYLNWTGTGLTVQGVIQTAATGKRLILDAVNNRFDVIESAGTNVVIRIDDDFTGVSTRPGMLIDSSDGGYFRISNTGAVGDPSPSQYCLLLENSISITNTLNTGASSAIFATRSGNWASGNGLGICSEYTGTDSDYILFQGQTSGTVYFAVRKDGLITGYNINLRDADAEIIAHSGVAYQSMQFDATSFTFECSNTDKVTIDSSGNIAATAGYIRAFSGFRNGAGQVGINQSITFDDNDGQTHIL